MPDRLPPGEALARAEGRQGAFARPELGLPPGFDPPPAALAPSGEAPARAVPDEAVTATTRHLARKAAGTVLPDLLADITRDTLPLTRLLAKALSLAADEALDAVAGAIAGQAAAAERERIRQQVTELREAVLYGAARSQPGRARVIQLLDGLLAGAADVADLLKGDTDGR